MDKINIFPPSWDFLWLLSIPSSGSMRYCEQPELNVSVFASVCLLSLSDFSLCIDYSICCHNAIWKVSFCLLKVKRTKGHSMAVTFSVIKNKYSGHITLKFPSSHPSPVFNFFYFLPIILCQGVAKILLRTVYCAAHLTCRQKEVLIRDNLLFCKKIFLNGIKKKKWYWRNFFQEHIGSFSTIKNVSFWKWKVVSVSLLDRKCDINSDFRWTLWQWLHPW